MKDDLWFRRQTYGWGWTPANGKGWAAVLVYVVAVSSYPYFLKNPHDFSLPVFLLITVGLTAAFFALCYWKGEKPEWRWGDRK